MKQLSVQQMEEINGGLNWACFGIAVVSMAASESGVGIIFYALAGAAAGCY